MKQIKPKIPVKTTSFILPVETHELLKRNAKYAEISSSKLIIALINAHDKLIKTDLKND